MAAYVKNKELREELIKSKEADKLTPECLDMMMLMANRFTVKFSYIYPQDREDCISFAILDCYLYWRGYNPERSQNAFAYITQIIKNGYAKGWRKLHGHERGMTRISLSSGKLYSL